MKKSFLLSIKGLTILLLIITNQVQSQVGIGTDNPKTLLHLKSKVNDNDLTKGIIFPVSHTLPEVKIEEQKERQGQLIFHEDQDQDNQTNNGFYYYESGSWKTLNTKPVIRAKYPVIGGEKNENAMGISFRLTECSSRVENSVEIATNPFKYTGTTITVPAGAQYWISVTQLIKFKRVNGIEVDGGEGVWLESSFSDVPPEKGEDPTYSKDIITTPSISGTVAGPLYKNLINGTIIIHNTSNKPKTYYYIAGKCLAYPRATRHRLEIEDFGTNRWEENIIVGIPLNY